MKPIRSFSGEHRWLSNFWPAAVRLGTITFPTVEHAYQAAKFDDPAFHRQLLTCTPGQAKRAAREIPIRADWEIVKLRVMETLVHQKFLVHDDLKARLLATGDAALIEGNHWGDRFWGVDARTGVGENHLGQILMRVRERLRETATQAA